MEPCTAGVILDSPCMVPSVTIGYWLLLVEHSSPFLYYHRWTPFLDATPTGFCLTPLPSLPDLYEPYRSFSLLPHPFPRCHIGHPAYIHLRPSYYSFGSSYGQVLVWTLERNPSTPCAFLYLYSALYLVPTLPHTLPFFVDSMPFPAFTFVEHIPTSVH